MTLPSADGGPDYDAVILVGFGGPEGPDDVVPFLENVTRGRGIPRERLVEVGAHYAHFGGRSPLNDQNRALRAALEAELRGRGVPVPVYWGNRNWHPMLAPTLREMRDHGVRRALVVLTSAYSSYSGCRQYRENLADAVAEVRADGLGEPPRLERIRQFYDQDGFLVPMADHVIDALGRMSDEAGDGVAAAAALVFSTHSIPTAGAAASGPPGLVPGGAYVGQHLVAAGHVAGEVARRTGAERRWDLVYQSRSGPPGQSWLEPDVSDHLRALAAEGVTGVVVVPVGFLGDHVEVLWDLDVVARDDARALGLAWARAATVETEPRFVAMLADLVVEHASPEAPRPSAAPWGPMPGRCAQGCCPNPRAARPALCGEGDPR